jgi:hypothetical protein
MQGGRQGRNAYILEDEEGESEEESLHTAFKELPAHRIVAFFSQVCLLYDTITFTS